MNIKIFPHLLFAILLLSLPIQAKEKPTDRHTLVIGLDGISYQTTLKMHESGYFRDFKRPIPMVATFPSISDPNWAHILDGPIEKGYTKAGFTFSVNEDGSIGREYGTLINHLTTPPQYEKKFDFKAEGVIEHLMSMTWTETTALYWTESLLRYLLESKNVDTKNVSKAFIMNTDIISHVGGEESIINYLKLFNKKIEEVRKDFKKKYQKNLEVIIVSDHGNHFKIPKAIDYKKYLEEKKYFQKSTLKEKTDYAFVAPEIISFGAFYVLPGEEKNFANAFKGIDGVHVALIDLGNNKIGVYSKAGESEIEIDPKGKTISYKIISGKDPFHQIDLFKKKKNISFDDYFYKTLKTDYPNALVRAWESFYKNSQDKASVLISPKLGYVFTNLTLEILTSISGVRSTHGSFHRKESFGVVMTTLPHKEEALTPFEVKDFIKEVTK